MVMREPGCARCSPNLQSMLEAVLLVVGLKVTALQVPGSSASFRAKERAVIRICRFRLGMLTRSISNLQVRA